MKPCNATTLEKILKLKQDNYPALPSRGSILLQDDRVVLYSPNGADSISMPAKDFRAISEWYLADQSAPSTRNMSEGQRNQISGLKKRITQALEKAA